MDEPRSVKFLGLLRALLRHEVDFLIAPSLLLLHQFGTVVVMSRSALLHAQDPTVARTIRFPAALRAKIAADAERCGRSFDGQVIALLRRHYGEDVDIAPNPAEILALAAASLTDLPAAEMRKLTRKLREPER